MATSAGAAAIAQERARQMDFEGWTPEHDAHHQNGELLTAGVAYARTVELRRIGFETGHLAWALPAGGFVAAVWPWPAATFKPVDDVRDLVRAASLIAAELDRLHQLGARLQ